MMLCTNLMLYMSKKTGINFRCVTTPSAFVTVCVNQLGIYYLSFLNTTFNIPSYYFLIPSPNACNKCL